MRAFLGIPVPDDIKNEVWRRFFELTYKADSCILYKSVLSNKGAEYTAVSVIKYNGAL